MEHYIYTVPNPRLNYIREIILRKQNYKSAYMAALKVFKFGRNITKDDKIFLNVALGMSILYKDLNPKPDSTKAKSILEEALKAFVEAFEVFNAFGESLDPDRELSKQSIKLMIAYLNILLGNKKKAMRLHMQLKRDVGFYPKDAIADPILSEKIGHKPIELVKAGIGYLKSPLRLRPNFPGVLPIIYWRLPNWA